MATEAAALGTIVKTVGLKGEVKLLPGPDFWPDVLGADGLDLVSSDKVRRPVHVDGYRTKGETYILKLSGIETIDDAQAVVGHELSVSLDDLDESVRPRELLPCQLMGLRVHLTDGSPVGEIVDLLLGPVQNCLVVERGKERFLVPDVPSVVKRIDLDKRSIEIDPPEGLLDLRW